MLFTSLSRATEDDPLVEDHVELETRRSPKLSNLFQYFVVAEQQFFSSEELASFGIDAIALPDIISLSCKGCHFQPLDSPIFTSVVYSLLDIKDKQPKPQLPDHLKYPGPVINLLETSQRAIWIELSAEKREALLENGYWGSISPMCTHKFFGVSDGMTHGPKLHYSITSLFEWVGPKENNPGQSHLKIYMTTACAGDEKRLTQAELSLIMNAFYNRVYEPGYEEHSIFPILLISEFGWCSVRIVEAVFDLRHEKVTLKFTPLCDFTSRDESPWDLFLRYEGSQPCLDRCLSDALVPLTL